MMDYFGTYAATTVRTIRRSVHFAYQPMDSAEFGFQMAYDSSKKPMVQDMLLFIPIGLEGCNQNFIIEWGNSLRLTSRANWNMFGKWSRLL